MGNLFSGKMFFFDFRKTSAWDYQRHLLRPGPTVTVTLHLGHDYVSCGPRLRWFWAIVPFDVCRDYAMWATITVKHKMRPTSQRNQWPTSNGITGPHRPEYARKDRDVMLSPALLEALRSYWRGLRHKPTEWLFPGNRWHTSNQPITTKVLWLACQHAAIRAGLEHKHIHPHTGHARWILCWDAWWSRLLVLTAAELVGSEE